MLGGCVLSQSYWQFLRIVARQKIQKCRIYEHGLIFGAKSSSINE
jgi:hypothetical protein